MEIFMCHIRNNDMNFVNESYLLVCITTYFFVCADFRIQYSSTVS